MRVMVQNVVRMALHDAPEDDDRLEQAEAIMREMYRSMVSPRSRLGPPMPTKRAEELVTFVCNIYLPAFGSIDEARRQVEEASPPLLWRYVKRRQLQDEGRSPPSATALRQVDICAINRSNW